MYAQGIADMLYHENLDEYTVHVRTVMYWEYPVK